MEHLAIFNTVISAKTSFLTLCQKIPFTTIYACGFAWALAQAPASFYTAFMHSIRDQNSDVVISLAHQFSMSMSCVAVYATLVGCFIAYVFITKHKEHEKMVLTVSAYFSLFLFLTGVIFIILNLSGSNSIVYDEFEGQRILVWEPSCLIFMVAFFVFKAHSVDGEQQDGEQEQEVPDTTTTTTPTTMSTDNTNITSFVNPNQATA